MINKELAISIGGHYMGWFRFTKHVWTEKPNKSCWMPIWTIYLGILEIRWMEYCWIKLQGE